MEQEQGGLQIDVEQVEQGQGVYPTELSAWHKVELQGRVQV